ncbi:MAG: STAS domain-containing protein [Methylococcales bacterium]|nr:STAS domain-containing protein [Methylococcales bacterium]
MSRHNGVSISRMHDRLSVTLQGDIVQKTLTILSTDMLERIQIDRINLVIFDLSAVEILDLTEFNALHHIALMIKLMGAESIFIGMNPGMVIFLVSAGADVSGINTAYGLEDIERVLSLIKSD